MKKSFVISMLFAFMATSLFGQRVEFFGIGAGAKIHKIEVFGKDFSETAIYGIGKFVYDFKDEEQSSLKKSLSGELFLGTPTISLYSPSFARGVAGETSIKFCLEQNKKDNPLGFFTGVSIGHLSALPMECKSDASNVLKKLGTEGYAEFLKMAKAKERLSENYFDAEFGLSYKLDGLEIGLSYSLRNTIGVSLVYDLRK